MTNKMSFADLCKIADDLGEQAGKGKDTQVKFLLAAVEGGYHGTLSLDANTHGNGIDDAQELSKHYVTAQGKHGQFNVKAGGHQKLMSTVRTGIKLGGWPKGGNGEPLGTVNNLMTIWQNLRKNPQTAKQLDDAANTLMKYARAQLKRDTLIDGDELTAMCYRKKNELATVEDILTAQRSALQKLYDGKAAQGTACDTSHEVKAAILSITARLKAIATAKGKAAGNGAAQNVQGSVPPTT